MEQPLQSLLFERIFKQYIKRSDAVNDIAEALEMSRDSVYRRIRNATLLTPDEIQVLALKFKISLDSLIYSNHDVVLFQYRPMTKPIKHFDQYLKTLFYDFERLYQTPNHQLYYASYELPIFFFFFMPELLSFKMYIWGRMIWELDYLKKYPFDFNLIPQSTHILAKEIAKFYMSIPSKDIWNISIFDNTLNQIDYLVNISAFKDVKDAITVCDKLIELVDLMRIMAETGKKGNSSAAIMASEVSFELYHNEIAYMNNTVMAVSDEGRVLFTSFDNPNFLRSTDQKFNLNTENWFKKVIARSSSISVNTERRRQWFFNVLEKKIVSLRNRIELMTQEESIPSFRG